MLGDTIEAIAAHKAGIIKPKVPLVTGKIPESALSVIDLEAAESEAPVSHLGEDYRVTYHRPDEIWGEWFDFENDRGKIKGLKTPMIGRHQPENAGVAIQLYYLFCELKTAIFGKSSPQWLKESLLARANGENQQ